MSRLQTAVSEGRVAGAVGLVARGNQILAFDAVGMADREAGTPMEKDTLFRIASMTKPITSVAVMVLFDEGRLALEDPVSKFIPELGHLRVLKGDGSRDTVEAAREITIRHLLTHTSGITYRFVGIEPIATLYEEAGVSDGLVETKGTIAEGVKRLAGLPLLHQPGERLDLQPIHRRPGARGGSRFGPGPRRLPARTDTHAARDERHELLSS